MSVKFVDFNYSDTLEDTCSVKTEEFENDNIQLNIENDDEEYNQDNQTTQNTQSFKHARFQHKRKPNEVTYDDILNSLGFGFNAGVLHRKETTEAQQYHQPNYQQLQTPKAKTMDPSVKNSAIYNKYFKNYKDPSYVEEPRIPLTPEQLKIKIIKDYIERVKAKRRIALIKPKKMLYSTQNAGISSHRQNPANLNKLFSFSNK